MFLQCIHGSVGHVLHLYVLCAFFNLLISSFTIQTHCGEARGETTREWCQSVVGVTVGVTWMPQAVILRFGIGIQV